MVSFYVFDIAFLILFTIGVIILLKTHKNMKREGIIFMYRTNIGIKAINWTSDKFKKILYFLKYIIIAVGLFMMGIMVYLLGQTVMIYITVPQITQVIKAPPIAPLIPYFPQIFKMESFFPNFYFTYFIIALAIVAIVHEFSHGIYMRLFKIKIKSTGFVFLGPILGAFVEEKKSDFEKKKNIEQMTVLGAGVFANLVTGLIFFGLYALFFLFSFSASGYQFSGYVTHQIYIPNITSFGDSFAKEIPNGKQILNLNLTEITVNNYTYYLDSNITAQLKENLPMAYIDAYSDTPAFKAQMQGAIIQADGTKIRNQEDLQLFLQSKNPGDKVNFVTENTDEKIKYYSIVLAGRPDNSSEAYLGIGSAVTEPRGIIQKTLYAFMSFKNPTTYYRPTWNADVVVFIIDLFWWIMVINLLVALFNMLPLGILDGGKFFYLTILSITRSKKIAAATFKLATYIILFVFIFLTAIWFFRVF